ncbi:right-handed parallel beta-helix repeat-containing protein [Jannaschia seohaensis]|uniref:right-handed parallel beta-helix repeat-containing protein n=1 Tax=Jannaschia seohaensis TaxID=475081 RepID=UPI001475C6C2|nr:right-handed parallel beta-helix repeat-containing protein [Jannaschia seohaensis]
MTEVSTIVIDPENADALYRIGEKYPAGVNVQLSPGEFVFEKTVFLPSNTSIVGSGKEKTRLVLAPGSHCHLFTNIDHQRGNSNLSLSGFSVEGHGDTQERQGHHKALTFCCAIYMKKTRDVRVEDVDFHDIRQTATHFNGSSTITVRNCTMRKLGWSGVSTSDASNMLVDVTISNAGRDTMHSGIHLDGGVGVLCRADVSDTTGNGVMLDSSYSPLRNVVVEGRASNCKRGLSLSGSAVKVLETVMISGTFVNNAEVGIMVSNARGVVLTRCNVSGNGQIGVLFQGRSGGRDCIVHDSTISSNPEDIKELHASGGNWVFTGDVTADATCPVNARSLSFYTASR